MAAGDGGSRVSLLHGMACGGPAGAVPESPAGGWLALRTDAGAAALEAGEPERLDGGFRVRLRSLDGRLTAASEWRLTEREGIWSRRDSVTNSGGSPVLLLRALSRFTFAPASYSVYSQGGKWAAENRGAWTDLTHGTFSLGSRGGRTAESETPYLLLR